MKNVDSNRVWHENCNIWFEERRYLALIELAQLYIAFILLETKPCDDPPMT